ncbi:GNAT family N-acetyltransferase [Cellulomonas triticagri]|uniref:GNAT family N-acetyltransferase n=1 Tax=Cellulomonas triticagri TaxID=2483352 RepID=A0A3M2JKC7_9CELL|nr:GNAT family N-acetyltransferase [Cellulomonas triticagri]RMI14282.1 GNAT family N-acetyltransferase [Cellulomonas triticagri]
MPAVPSPSFTLQAVDYTDPRAAALRAAMDEEMGARYADGPGLSAAGVAALTVDPATIRHTVLAVDADGTPIGHAALRDLRGEWEVKRVVVAAAARGRGVGRAVMAELERLARAGGATRMILQTGDRQPEAEALYVAVGWTPIPAYAPYADALPMSRCYARHLG